MELKKMMSGNECIISSQPDWNTLRSPQMTKYVQEMSLDQESRSTHNLKRHKKSKSQFMIKT